MSEIENLMKYGITFSKDEMRNAKYKLRDKHWYKYSKVAGFLRRKHFEKINWYKVQFTYRSDIVIRRIIDEFIKGYEETIESRIMHLSSQLNWSLSSNSLNIKWMDWSDLNRTTRNKKNEAKKFFEKSIKKIFDKSGQGVTDSKINFKIIEELSFGQKIALFSIIDNESAYYMIDSNHTNIKRLYEGFTPDSYINLNRKKFEIELNKMRILRNIISHVNILFTGKEKHGHLSIKELISSLDFLMGYHTTFKLREKIEKYMKNTISINNKSHDIYRVTNKFIEEIIKSKIKEMFNE